MKTEFEIKIEQPVLDDLKERLRLIRWPDEVEGAGWDYGTSLAYLKELCGYWLNTYDWRKQESILNKLPHFKTTIEDTDLHFIYIKGKGTKPVPLLLLHGWPDSFYRFHKIIPLLAGQSEIFDTAGLSFDLVIPSLPGMGFTSAINEIQQQPMRHTTKLLWTLMTKELGYEKFIAAGGDGGSPISQTLAIDYPQSVSGIYITDLGWHVANTNPSDLSKTEKHYLEKSQQYAMKESAYAMLQGTKPQTLAYSLNDSPAGLAAWITDRFYAWCDCDKDIEKSFSKDELLTNIMIYWVTSSIASSMRNYKAEMMSPALTAKNYVNVPVGMGLFPKDIGGIPPREFAERTLNIVHWKEMPEGGHFAPWEQPELFAADLLNFVKKIQ